MNPTHKNTPGFPSQSLTTFRDLCHQYYTCYTAATIGFEQFATQLQPLLTGDPNQSLFVGNGHPDKGQVKSRIPMRVAVAYLRKDGEFTDRIAKAILVTIYAEGDERYRPMMASEFGIPTKQIKSDLMGDVRHVRNWIVHNKSIVDEKRHSLKILQWQVEEGELKINRAMFAVLMDMINQMLVTIN
jgi:hypothetical protein